MGILAHKPEMTADILIVDDKVANIRLWSDCLASKNYYVRQSLNGKAALNAVHFKPPDLMLLDINMPEGAMKFANS